MKKVLTLALAVFAVAAAQAVTINWKLSLSGPSNTAGDNPGYAPGWCGLVMTTETITDKASFKNLITITGDTSFTVANANTTAIIMKDDATYANMGETWGAITHSFTTDATSNTVTFALFNIYNVNSTDGGFAFLTVSGITDITEGYTGEDPFVIDLSGTTLAWAKGTVNTSSVTVPEPTALALLALGVAGLALKRKHA